ncbi:MAG TPA: biopolymer transporter Tol [Opitutaceae bacterium]|nr:biopolymer transporter Tol [Opitutaceae bacterium]
MIRKIAFCILLAAGSCAAFAQSREIGTVDIAADARATTVRITGDADLRPIAETAFRTHGRYRVTADRASYVINFTAAGGNQVRVEVSTGNPARSVFAETLSGTSKRNALFRAADAAVRQTSGLPGFFASKLTFISDKSGKREVCTSDLFFGEAVQLTNDRADALSPRWSPNGSQIVYTSYFGTGFPDIYVIDVASRQRKPLATFKGTNTGARFSPDGSRVAMVLSGEGNSEIYVKPAAGGAVKRLTRNQSVEASPAWSPDGSRLVFTSDSAGKPQLYQMSAAGGAMTRVPTNISGYCAEPDWSVGNPNKIVFTIAMGSRFVLAVYDFSTGKSTTVATGPGDAIEPSWLADGRHVVFTARGPNTRRTMIVDTETGKATRLSGDGLGQVSHAHVLAPR